MLVNGYGAAMPKPRLAVHEVGGYPPPIGKTMWMTEDCRRRTLSALDGVEDRDLDLLPPGFENTIGSLLYHLAAIEADWLYQDILGAPYPDWLGEVFPIDAHDGDGRLSRMEGARLADHLGRLETVRGHMLDELRALGPDDLDVPRTVEDHEVTPGWVLHHLRQHEAEHRGQIQAIRTALRAS